MLAGKTSKDPLTLLRDIVKRFPGNDGVAAAAEDNRIAPPPVVMQPSVPSLMPFGTGRGSRTRSGGRCGHRCPVEERETVLKIVPDVGRCARAGPDLQGRRGAESSIAGRGAASVSCSPGTACADFRRVLDDRKCEFACGEIDTLIREERLPSVEVIDPVAERTGFCPDPGDDKFAALALAADADCIVTAVARRSRRRGGVTFCASEKERAIPPFPAL